MVYCVWNSLKIPKIVKERARNLNKWIEKRMNRGWMWSWPKWKNDETIEEMERYKNSVTEEKRDWQFVQN